MVIFLRKNIYFLRSVFWPVSTEGSAVKWKVFYPKVEVWVDFFVKKIQECTSFFQNVSTVTIHWLDETWYIYNIVQSYELNVINISFVLFDFTLVRRCLSVGACVRAGPLLLFAQVHACTNRETWMSLGVGVVYLPVFFNELLFMFMLWLSSFGSCFINNPVAWKRTFGKVRGVCISKSCWCLAHEFIHTGPFCG